MDQRTPNQAHEIPYSLELQHLASRSSPDVAAELCALREEISALREAQIASQVERDALKEVVAKLEQENARLVDVNGRFAAIAEERWRQILQRRNAQACSIPYEVLLHIFQSTQPERHECDPSVVPGPRNRWLEGLRTKTALTLVCRAWMGPATELLYADIVLRRMGQITALANTLRTQDPRSHLSLLVKGLRMDSCIVLQPCADVVRSDLEFLLRECTQLRSFSFHVHPLFPFAPSQVNNVPYPITGAPAHDGFNPSWILEPEAAHSLLTDRLASGLSTLDIAAPLVDSNLLNTVNMLLHATSLTSLSLGRVMSMDTAAMHPTLHLPALTTLQLYLDHHPFAEYITTQWQMPRLTALTCLWSGTVPVPLLAAHGSKLTYLHFYDDLWPAFLDRGSGSLRKELEDGWTLLPCLHELCPEIEHLILPIDQTQLSTLCVRSPTLRYLDISHPKYANNNSILVATFPSIRAHKSIALAQDSDASSLQSVRFIQVPGSAPQVPIVCHPSLFRPNHAGATAGPIADTSPVKNPDEVVYGGRKGGVIHVFPNTRMRQRAWVVGYKLLPEWKDKSESEYRPPPVRDVEDEWDDGTSWISDDGSEVSSCVDSEAEDPEECGNYDRETVLRMFRAGLEGDFVLDDIVGT